MVGIPEGFFAILELEANDMSSRELLLFRACYEAIARAIANGSHEVPHDPRLGRALDDKHERGN